MYHHVHCASCAPASTTSHPLATLFRGSYIEADNPAAALALDELFRRKSGYLTEQPRLGRPGRKAGTRELWVHSNYVLIYDIQDKQLRILRVLHAARQWPIQK